jgi:hypothetical protein
MGRKGKNVISRPLATALPDEDNERGKLKKPCVEWNECANLKINVHIKQQLSRLLNAI